MDGIVIDIAVIVIIVCAVTGCTARANPAANEVMTNSRRVRFCLDSNVLSL